MGRWEHGRELSREYIGGPTVSLIHVDYEDWHCGKCQYVVKQSNKPEWNYCPNCGDYKGTEEENNKIRRKTEMTIDEINKEIYFAKMIIGVIDNVETPMLMYDEEKSVTKKALMKYVDELESKLRGQ